MGWCSPSPIGPSYFPRHRRPSQSPAATIAQTDGRTPEASMIAWAAGGIGDPFGTLKTVASSTTQPSAAHSLFGSDVFWYQKFAMDEL